jgi:hypothetical protein
MNTPNHLIKSILVVLVLTIPFTGFSQISTDSLSADTTAVLPDSIHDFHRKKGDVLNYLLVDNFNNPALAGSLKSYQAQASYGNHLPGSRNNIHYGNIMLDMFFGNRQGRHGLAYRMGMNHIAFRTSITQRIDYSFQILNKKNISLRAGVGVGFTMEQNLPADFTFGDMIDNRYGYIYSTQETFQYSSTSAFRVSRFQWNVGAQLRIANGYINIYNNNTQTTIANLAGQYYYIPGFGVNTLYNFQLKKMQIIPSLQFNYITNHFYLLQGGVFLASNTSKGGGGGIHFNNMNVLGITGMFAWNDYLRIYTQVQFPLSEISYTYPVSNFQLTVSYKINDFGKYE